MKMQYKVFKALNNEPVLTQEIEGKTVEIHFMNDTPFLAQFAGRGRFAEWTSDGKKFKLIVEKGYYETMDGFYTVSINKVWIDFLTNVGKVYRKITRFFLLGIVVLYTLVAVLGALFFKEQLTNLLIGSLILVLVGNIFQSRILRKFIAKQNSDARQTIIDTLGEAKYNELLDKQDAYYKAYFKFEEETTEVLEDNERIENGEEDGTESN